jgi:protein-tyrosine phosphatase
VDLHTHVLPGVDDGARDLEGALEALRLLAADGVTTVVATPHLNASRLTDERRARAESAWSELLTAVGRQLPRVQLHRGFEIQLDVPDVDLSDAGLRLGGSRFALVEFLAFTVPPRSAETLAEIARRGQVPVLAHPERYWGYDRDFRLVPRWRAAGALLQLNGGSLLGEYGESVRAVAHRFLAEGWIDIIASDNHGRPERRPSLRPVWDYLTGHGFEEQARLLLAVNPGRVLRDEPPLEVGPLKWRRGLLSRLARTLKGGLSGDA